MAIETRNFKKEYKEQINKTLDEIKTKTDCLLDDINDYQVRGIQIIINVEAGTLVTYTINKEYLTKGDE